MVLRDSREVACQQWWLLQLCPPQWKGGTAVGELMRIAKWGDCVEIQGRGCGGSTGHTQGASKVTKNSPKCPQLPSSQGLGCFCGWSGKATDAAAACPSAPSGRALLRAREEAECCDPTPAFPSCCVLDFSLRLKHGCPRWPLAIARAEREGERCSAAAKEGKPCSLLLAAVPVLRDHPHLLFFHLFT